MDFDADRVTFVDTRLFPNTGTAGNENISKSDALSHFREFIQHFHVGPIFPYRDQLLHNWRKKNYILEVALADLDKYNDKLLILIQEHPVEYLAMIEAAAKMVLENLAALDKKEDEEWPDIQVLVKSEQTPQPLRQVTADHVNKLIKIPGIVISASKIRAKAVSVRVRCSKCGATKTVPCPNPFGGAPMPSGCDGQGDGRRVDDGGLAPPNCGPFPFMILPDQCKYIDQQTLKLQESPEVVPTGEMPRNMLVSVDRYLVDRVSPGTRVSLIGISSLFNSAAGGKIGGSGIRTPFLRVVGIQVESEGSGRADSSFTPAEEEMCLTLARSPTIYQRLADSIAPSISGDYTRDIKKALACQLMGGSRKSLPDGMRLRGDINILLLGDPSTAKSQFLKFIEKVAPVGVYTSGKGSSAAGLTASVIKDKNGEFFLEGGAMVLADGGTVCIDEFDKMREQDRVAIHEAMEQQTISVAKAGITTILNSRTSVLAAANPIFGRYDDLKSANDNIDLMTTILSRFDLIFIVRDVRDEARDKSIARHVMGIHMSGGSTAPDQSTLSQTINTVEGDGPLDLGVMKKFVSYCRQRCAPRLSEQAAEMLASQYVIIREEMRKQAHDVGEAQAVPITVRQLEALVRISEARAKMRLSAEVQMEDVEESIRLFKVSTLSAASSGTDVMNMQSLRPEVRQEVNKAEDFVKQRLPLGTTANVRKICEEACAQGHSDYAIKRALAIMVKRQEIIEKDQGRLIRRLR